MWSGHTHLYSSTCPIAAGQCRGYDVKGQARAPVHVCYGMGGAEMQAVTETLAPVPLYFQTVLYSYGYMRVEADASVLRMYMVSDTYRDNVTKVELRRIDGKADWWFDNDNAKNVTAVQAAAEAEYDRLVDLADHSLGTT